MLQRCCTRLSKWAHVAELEQQLLSHFAPSRDLLRMSPLALQVATGRDAAAVTSSALFPPFTVPRQAAPLMAGESEGGGGGGGGGEGRTPHSCNDTTTTAAVGLSHSEATKFIEGLRFDRSGGDLLDFRVIGPRQYSFIDAASKDVRATEAPVEAVRRDVRQLWEEHVRPAVAGLSRALSSTSSSSSSPTRLSDKDRQPPQQQQPPLAMPTEVVFIVAFSESRHMRPVGSLLHRIAHRVKAIIEESGTAANPDWPLPTERVLAVFPIFIGVDTAASSTLSYPVGGLYTAGTVLDCIGGLPPLPLPSTNPNSHNSSSSNNTGTTSVASDNGQRRRPLMMKRNVLVISDAYMHPNLLADMYGRRATNDQYGTSHSNDARGDLSVQVLPAVVSPGLSPTEEEALARYAVCQLLRE